MLGDKPLSASTYGDYKWRLNLHSLPFLGSYRLDEPSSRVLAEASCAAARAPKLDADLRSGDWDFESDPDSEITNRTPGGQSMPWPVKKPSSRQYANGESRTRTRDTTIFRGNFSSERNRRLAGALRQARPARCYWVSGVTGVFRD